MAERLRRILASRWVLAIAAALAFALTLPSLGNGFEIDDHLYRARVVDEHWSIGRATTDLFVFANPDRPADVEAAMATGELSWWAAPQLRWRFLRPIPAAMLWAEWHAYGHDGGPWMHLHSVLWMAGLAALVAALYRRLLGATWLAGLAAVLYAIDDGHGFAVGWLSDRCGVMAACAGVLALLAHDRWRRDGWRPGIVLGPLAVGLAVLCSEEGVAVLGFLAAYELVLVDGGRRRVAGLAPYVMMLGAWYAIRAGLGYGSDGTGSYTDPIHEPVAFAIGAAQRIPIYVHSLLGALPADLWEVFFVRHGLAWAMALAGLAFAALVLACFARLLRTDRVARFFAAALVLSLVLVCGAHPNDRHLLLVSVAGSALVARFLAAAIDREASRAFAVFLFAVHAVFAPVLLPVRARIPGSVARGVERIDALVPSDSVLATQDLVLVNVPFKYLCNFASVVRRSNGGISPQRWRCLGVSPGDVAATRVDDRTLVLRPAHGYLEYFEDTNVRARRIPFAVGDRVELPDFSVTIRAITDDARPAEVEFHFVVPLEDPSLRWLAWHAGAYRPYAPPPVGTTRTIPAEAFAFGDLLEDRP